MKKIKLSTLNAVFSLCLVMTYYVKFSGISFLFWGEPKFPVAEDYE